MKAIATKATAPFAYDLSAPVPRTEQDLVRKTGRTELKQSLNVEMVWVTFEVARDTITICVCRERTLTWADLVFDLNRAIANEYGKRMRGATILDKVSPMAPMMGAPRYLATLA